MENNMKKKPVFKMALTLKQLHVLEIALDLYTRIGMGQVEVIGEKINTLFPYKKLTHYALKEKYLDKLKKEVFGFDSNASYGIACKEVSKLAKIGYDLQKTIQKTIAEEEEHHKSSVWHHGNILHLGSEPLAKIVDINSPLEERLNCPNSNLGNSGDL